MSQLATTLRGPGRFFAAVGLSGARERVCCVFSIGRNLKRVLKFGHCCIWLFGVFDFDVEDRRNSKTNVFSDHDILVIPKRNY